MNKHIWKLVIQNNIDLQFFVDNIILDGDIRSKRSKEQEVKLVTNTMYKQRKGLYK